MSTLTEYQAEIALRMRCGETLASVEERREAVMHIETVPDAGPAR